MRSDEPIRRDVLYSLAGLPLIALLAKAGEAAAQPTGSPVKVDTGGLVARIKFEAPLAGFLTDLNGKYKLRVTELTLAPGGHVGEHNHVGPGIRQVTSGYMTYVLPDKTVVYGPGEFFFESGDINHTVFNKTSEPMVHVLFEVLPADLNGPSLIPVKKQTFAVHLRISALGQKRTHAVQQSDRYFTTASGRAISVGSFRHCKPFAGPEADISCRR
jgi:quercetin dioxygenase-like cupin family protein